MELWLEFLQKLTDGDEEFMRYLQEVIGSSLVGKVYDENLIIAVGTGGNGKSTFFDTIFRVYGTYGGLLSASVLEKAKYKNSDPELAQLRGKRLVIAAELKEGSVLDTQALKKICSTTPIKGRLLYKNPIEFIPTHTTILQTNNMPVITADDDGTWDRIVVLPFLHRFRNTEGEVKNYGDFLFNNCGGAILLWAIEGAKRYIDNGCHLVAPERVKEATRKFRESADWLAPFLTDCCEPDYLYRQQSSDLYGAYTSYCLANGEHPQTNKAFKAAMERHGYPVKHGNKYQYFEGTRLVNAPVVVDWPEED